MKAVAYTNVTNDDWVMAEPEGGHKGPWVVLDESRDERTIWGPFEDAFAAEKWIAHLLEQYMADGEDQTDYIDYEALFRPMEAQR